MGEQVMIRRPEEGRWEKIERRNYWREKPAGDVLFYYANKEMKATGTGVETGKSLTFVGKNKRINVFNIYEVAK